MNSWFPSLPGNLIVWSVIRGTGEEKQWTRSSKRQQTHQCHPPFPGTMTTETTVSKGQEFFSPGQTEGDTGGTLIGSAAVSLLLLTQPRRTSCAIWTGNVLVMKVKRKTVRDTNKKKKRNRECWRLTAFMSHYEEDIQPCHTRQYPLFTERHIESKLISLRWPARPASIFSFSMAAFSFKKMNCAVRMSMTNSGSWRWRVWIALFCPTVQRPEDVQFTRRYNREDGI